MSCADGPSDVPDTKSGTPKLKPSAASGPALPPSSSRFRSLALGELPQAPPGHPAGGHPPLLRVEGKLPAVVRQQKSLLEELGLAEEAVADESEPESSEDAAPTLADARKAAIDALRNLAAKEYPLVPKQDIHVMLIVSGTGMEPLVCVD